ncbi:hypothetical protein E2320_014577, partial [Naja naja]
EEHFNYYKPGDFLIGAIISTSNTAFKPYIFFQPPSNRFQSIKIMSYSHILPFFFAILEINQNPRMLLNITVGYNVYENYFNAGITHDRARECPKLQMWKTKNLLVVLEATNSELFNSISTMLRIYKISPTLTIVKFCSGKTYGLPQLCQISVITIFYYPSQLRQRKRHDIMIFIHISLLLGSLGSQHFSVLTQSPCCPRKFGIHAWKKRAGKPHLRIWLKESSQKMALVFPQ